MQNKDPAFREFNLKHFFVWHVTIGKSKIHVSAALPVLNTHLNLEDPTPAQALKVLPTPGGSYFCHQQRELGTFKKMRGNQA
jgi:hypothetical protein